MPRRTSTKGKLKEWLATANAEVAPAKKPKRKRRQQPPEEPYDSTAFVEQFLKKQEETTAREKIIADAQRAIAEGRRTKWTVERFVLLWAVLMSPLGFCFYFFGGLITVPWAIWMWRRHWPNRFYGYRPDGTMKKWPSEM